MRQISLGAARRATVSSLGLARSARPRGRVDLRHIDRVMRSLGILQIDSVNVVERAHQLVLFSRLGPYDTELLWRSFRDRRLFEYWGHEASILPSETWPLWQHRMTEFATSTPWKRARQLMEEEPGYVEAVLAEVGERGPLIAADLDDPGEKRGPWWGWAKGKVALEWLFATGRVTTTDRRNNFTRYYDVPERVIPDAHRDAPPVSRGEALRELVVRAARSFSVGTAKDLADYYRLPITEARATVADLAQEGLLEQVEVEGWRDPGFVHPEATFPNRVRAQALVCPFDPLIWFRERTERLFDFHYRIEIYVPEPKRVYGYYVFPLLIDDRLVARVDLKADRKADVLRVPGAFLEPGHDPDRAIPALVAELADMATWLGMSDIAVGDRGDLAAPLATAIG